MPFLFPHLFYFRAGLRLPQKENSNLQSATFAEILPYYITLLMWGGEGKRRREGCVFGEDHLNYPDKSNTFHSSQTNPIDWYYSK